MKIPDEAVESAAMVIALAEARTFVWNATMEGYAGFDEDTDPAEFVPGRMMSATPLARAVLEAAAPHMREGRS